MTSSNATLTANQLLHFLNKLQQQDFIAHLLLWYKLYTDSDIQDDSAAQSKTGSCRTKKSPWDQLPLAVRHYIQQTLQTPSRHLFMHATCYRLYFLLVPASHSPLLATGTPPIIDSQLSSGDPMTRSLLPITTHLPRIRRVWMFDIVFSPEYQRAIHEHATAPNPSDNEWLLDAIHVDMTTEEWQRLTKYFLLSLKAGLYHVQSTPLDGEWEWRLLVGLSNEKATQKHREYDQFNHDEDVDFNDGQWIAVDELGQLLNVIQQPIHERDHLNPISSDPCSKNSIDRQFDDNINKMSKGKQKQPLFDPVSANYIEKQQNLETGNEHNSLDMRPNDNQDAISWKEQERWRCIWTEDCGIMKLNLLVNDSAAA